jgi:hypothetical protein
MITSKENERRACWASLAWAWACCALAATGGAYAVASLNGGDWVLIPASLLSYFSYRGMNAMSDLSDDHRDLADYFEVVEMEESDDESDTNRQG